MDIIDYLKKYQHTSFKEEPFNECDALILSLVSYFPFDKLEKPKKTYNAKTLYQRLVKYQPDTTNQRRIDLYVLMKELCLADRYKGIVFHHFVKNKDSDIFKQFQAVSVSVFDFLFVSFCGTDSSTTGWREDLNMSCMDMVHAEVEAISYINKVAKAPFKKHIMIGGHSKGGRLSIRAAKSLKKKKKLTAIYNFDGPNFKDNFYDDEFTKIEPLIHEYAPDESIIGRLFCAPQNIIVIASNRHLLNQHNAFSWLIEDKEFIRRQDFSNRSNNIVAAINTAITKYNDDVKQQFVDALFELLDSLNINDFSSTEALTASLKEGLLHLPKKWKTIPKEAREVLVSIIMSLFKEYIKKSFS